MKYNKFPFTLGQHSCIFGNRKRRRGRNKETKLEKRKEFFGTKRKIALAMSFILLLVSILTIGAMAAYTGKFYSTGAQSGQVTLWFSMSKYNVVSPPRQATNVSLREYMDDSKLKMDSFKIDGEVKLRSSTLNKSATAGNGSSATCTVGLAFGAEIVSATGIFNAYSTAFGNAYQEASCMGSEL
ncbi:MAG TPA: hypothetical protein H9674_08165 [Firmicutes bacterium]|nr:hypothetical protein [Bacillota bacterium]